MNLIIKAAKFAQKAHEGQKRKYSGVDYIIHPGRVANLYLLYCGDNEEDIAICWLHDVLEDCEVEYIQLLREFGVGIANGVWELTNPSKQHPELRRAERKAMDRKHLEKAPLRIKAIKLADRLDNFRDVPDDEEFKEKYASESHALLQVIADGNRQLASDLTGEIQKFWYYIRRKNGIQDVCEDLELK